MSCRWLLYDRSCFLALPLERTCQVANREYEQRIRKEQQEEEERQRQEMQREIEELERRQRVRASLRI